MKITVLCSDVEHPINEYLNAWAQEINESHDISIVRTCDELTGGDFLFLISCSELIKAKHRENYRYSLVLHASDLPEGRGWSPHIWGIIKGREVITLSLLEAEDKVDSGRIWLKREIPVEKTAIWSDVNHLLFQAEIKLMNEVLVKHQQIKPYQQNPYIEPTYHRKRTLEDSKVEPSLSIAEQFNLIRMCDPDRYPAWFEMHGHKYKLILEKVENE